MGYIMLFGTIELYEPHQGPREIKPKSIMLCWQIAFRLFKLEPIAVRLYEL